METTVGAVKVKLYKQILEYFLKILVFITVMSCKKERRDMRMNENNEIKGKKRRKEKKKGKEGIHSNFHLCIFFFFFLICIFYFIFTLSLYWFIHTLT